MIKFKWTLLILIGLGLLNSQQASARRLSGVCGRYLELLRPSERLVELSKRMAQRDREVAQLLKPASYILNVEGRVDLDPGVASHGVWAVSTPEGRKIAKVIFGSYLIRTPQIVIQNFLADLNDAPRIVGVIKPEESQGLFPRKSGFDEIESIEIMDEIPEAWNILKSDRVPAGLLQWNRDQIVSDIRRIERDLKRYGIVPRDAQIGISKSGQVFVMDLDLYHWVSPSGELLQGDYAFAPRRIESKILNLALTPLFSFSDFIRAYDEKLAVARSVGLTSLNPRTAN